MKKIIITLIFVGLAGSAFAQKDPAAEKILIKLSDEIKSHKTIQADFTINFKNIKENIQNNSSGTLLMKGDKYHLDFMGTISFFDGKTLWNYIEEVNEVNITEPEPDDEDIFSNPKKLFTIYEQGFKYKLDNTFLKDGDDGAIVDLYPEDLNEEFSRIRLEINTSQNTITSATIFGKDGSHYTIELFNYKLNKPVSDSKFTFNESDYKNVEIIDMRF
jgi:outer membrane lipoprotein-sorting protein